MATQIGAQMFTLREHCETPSDIAKTCAKLKNLGFGAIQASAAGFGKIEAGELKKILDDTGLACAATHFGVDFMKDTDQFVDWHKAVGCEYSAVGGFNSKGNVKSEWQAFANDYSEVAKACAAKGVKIGYHNHSHELSPFGLEDAPGEIDPNQIPLQLLADSLDESAWFEIDTYWIAHGGGDPAAWIEKLAGRVDCIHVKDMTISPQREHKMCEVGAGNLNWPAILAAAKKAGVKWYLIERDTGDLDPFDSLKISLDNLHAMGIK